MSKRKECVLTKQKCVLIKPTRKNYGLVASCLICHKLYVCNYRLYVPYSPRCGGYYFWEEIKGK